MLPGPGLLARLLQSLTGDRNPRATTCLKLGGPRTTRSWLCSVLPTQAGPLDSSRHLDRTWVSSGLCALAKWALNLSTEAPGVLLWSWASPPSPCPPLPSMAQPIRLVLFMRVKNWKPTRCPQIRGCYGNAEMLATVKEYAAVTVLFMKSLPLSMASRPLSWRPRYVGPLSTCGCLYDPDRHFVQFWGEVTLHRACESRTVPRYTPQCGGSHSWLFP